MKIDKKEASTKEGRPSVGGLTNTSTECEADTYCEMALVTSSGPGAAPGGWSQAGEDMASLISFGSLVTSSSGGSAGTDQGQVRSLPTNSYVLVA